MSTSSLFLIAKDLKRIQVWASVNEADIGNIHPGQPVTFTVDAFGDKLFHGVVGKIRLNATMSQNVVTYTVEVNCDNFDGKLLPYLTTNLQFETGGRQMCCSCQTRRCAGLRSQDKCTARARSAGRGFGTGGGPSGTGAPESHGTLWVARGNFVRPVHVGVGLSDGV